MKRADLDEKLRELASRIESGEITGCVVFGLNDEVLALATRQISASKHDEKMIFKGLFYSAEQYMKDYFGEKAA